MRNKWINRIGLVAALVPALAACNAHPLKSVELKSEQEKDGNVAVAINRDVDILFVIDNSGSMAEEQATLAKNFGPLIKRLEEDDVRANYRIAVTTTDNGFYGGLCGVGDNGNFQATSCLQRPEDFKRGEDGDVFDAACADICSFEDIETLPTTTFGDPEAKPRPWIESINGVTNLPDGITPVEAFECFAPQGITGCPYEAPLETMRKSLLQARDDRSGEFGFMRPGAILAVVFVTDEADCSARYADVTDPWRADGSKALWSDANLESTVPYSEVCWFAGVECEELPDGTKECEAVDKQADGTLAADEDDAVLHPLDRYTDFLTKLEEEKKEINPDQELLVAVLTGVPTDYGGEELQYADGTDADFLSKTGIGPGCASTNGKAAPPVRMARFAEEFRGTDDANNLFSVCKEDYSDSMSAIAEAISKQVRPPCVETCVADTDLTREGLQHNCQVLEEFLTVEGETESYPIPACLEGDGGFEFPEGVDVCYRSLTDADALTDRTDDDMSEQCVDGGWNLELAIERRDDAPAPAGARVQARCSVSRLSEIDCPDLVDG